MVRHKFPLLASQRWPENLQWPTSGFVPDFQAIDGGDDERPAGTVGLRFDAGGDQRTDYYLDPNNDYVCVKQSVWIRRDGHWNKDDQVTLRDLHRVEGRVVAGTMDTEDFGDSGRHGWPSTNTTTIDLTLVPPAAYPPGAFDPDVFIRGTDVAGY